MAARATLEESGLLFSENASNAWWLCASVCWARNQVIGESGYSPSQWILGRGLSLPTDLLSSAGKLDVAMRMEEKPAFAARLRLRSGARHVGEIQECVYDYRLLHCR